MHFIGEACYRRPLEPRALAYSRGGTAITMGFLFLAFCGYLIALIYNDKPLTQISSETITYDIETPDVEFCAQNSTMTLVKCSAMYYNWTMVDIPNCFQDFVRPGANGDASKCYVFESRKKYRMATGLSYDSRDALRRLDFYWNIDELQNLTYSTISIPAIAIQLYDPSFTPWYPETIGTSEVEQTMITNMKLGASRATSFLNYTSSIFYRPQKYRAIRPRDAGTILGLKSNFIDIITLLNTQHNWPIQQPTPPPPALDKSLYHGVFSVQLSQGTIDIKTEIRQHTLLASVALAGGCYGVLTTIYILLFGMTRLTPWGLVHHIPVFISKHRNHDMMNKKFIQEEGMYQQDQDTHTSKSDAKKKGFSTSVLIPWFFRSSKLRNSNDSFTSADVKEAIMTQMIVRNATMVPDQTQKLSRVDSTELHLLDTDKRTSSGTQGGQQQNEDDKQYNDIPLSPLPRHGTAEIMYQSPQLPLQPPALPPHYNTASGSTSRSDNATQVNQGALLQKQQADPWEERTTELSNRVEELEIILSEYFINTAYLDQLRARKSSILSNVHKQQEKNHDN
ncbi:hypothetical protein INT47_006561 [Mucor saturninus]|uniref:Uncharacterized protein n=1 Tax=Mucor saturninus TaxID=64648 RepID=A0A8H7QYB7_9FUNG|nr:hypothetical protein INT47_006561 [Mucor saturninus]